MPPSVLSRGRGLLPSYRRPLLGLALGGGGARGYAHIGVLKVLQRENVPVDYLAGTSMGGLIAAGYAIGMTVAELEAEALKLRLRDLLDVSLPRAGLMEGKRVREHLLRIFGDRQFSDTTIPLRLVAVDIDSGEELAISEGSLVDAIRATISVPGILCPAEWRGRLLVDGGLSNNVPAGVARDMGAEVVVAVDVGNTSFEPLFRETERRKLSLPRLARFNPMVSVLVRSVDIMQANILRDRLAEAHPEVLIQPDVGPVNMEEFDRAAEVIPRGESAAAQAMPRIREALRKRVIWRS